MKNKSITQNTLPYTPVPKWQPRYKSFFRQRLIKSGITPALFCHLIVCITSAISLMGASNAVFFLKRDTCYTSRIWKKLYVIKAERFL